VVRRWWRSTAALRAAVRGPADFVLAARIAAFVVAAPRELARADVASYLEDLRRAPRPHAGDRDASQQRVVRLRNGVLSLPWFWRRNNCYVRALVLCRFLDAGSGVVRIHIGIEQRETDAHLHGHAWVTVDAKLIEGPEGVLLERLREIPVHARR
jgi:Transglutaminase-like superfamily